MLTRSEIDELLARYGRGDLEVGDAVVALREVLTEPGGDSYHHHAAPEPPAYLNPGAPAIPEAYRDPDAGRRQPRSRG